MADDGTNMVSHDVMVRVTNKEEMGTVTLSPMAPSIDSEITTDLTDPDGGITGTTWQWSRSMTMDGTYDVIEMANSMTYTPVDDEGYYLRATASYDDGEGSDKTADGDDDEHGNRRRPAAGQVRPQRRRHRQRGRHRGHRTLLR